MVNVLWLLVHKIIWLMFMAIFLKDFSVAIQDHPRLGMFLGLQLDVSGGKPGWSFLDTPSHPVVIQVIRSFNGFKGTYGNI